MQVAGKLSEPNDGSAPVGIQHEPTAILGMAGMVGALTVFLFLGGWKTRTINAQTVPGTLENSHAIISASSSPAPASTNLSPAIPVNPITSRNVNLYEDAKPESVNLSPSAEDSSAENLNDAHVAVTPSPAKPAPRPKQTRLAASTDKPLLQKNVAGSGNAQTLASLSPTESIVASNSAAPATLASVATPTESLSSPDPVANAGNAAAQPKSVDSDAKTSKLYVEVGSFKDETWASSAVDKLTQLGFHAVLVHKNLLWVNSYHVQVGPYANKKDLAEAQKDLATHGFKAHPVS
jgi:cell division protein FtsN